MFIVCKACDGSGEGVYGQSWTECPVCHGAGQVVMELQPVPYFEAPVMPKAKITLKACVPTQPVRCGRNSVSDDTDPTGVFPDPEYQRRTAVAA